MEDEHAWDRILEAVRLLAKHFSVVVPQPLIVVEGNQWKRNATRRRVLNDFLQAIEAPTYESSVSLNQIADELDMLALDIPTEE